ncbi:MAG: hypothetical protein H7319_20650 [Spirosoma sp.]|nr:hypothetical protein [Spirosoma sp.]
MVTNIDLPKGYELILAPHLKKYESEIKEAITRKRYSNINSEFSRTQGKSGSKMYEREYEEVLKNNLFSDQKAEVVLQGFDSEGTICRVDFVAKLKGTDEIVFIEVKTGNAQLSKNQEIVYSRACTEGCKLKSSKDILGFKTGSTIKPVKVYLYRDGVPEVIYPK